MDLRRLHIESSWLGSLFCLLIEERTKHKFGKRHALLPLDLAQGITVNEFYFAID